MLDYSEETGKRDHSRIIIYRAHEITYWTRVFKCTPAQLRQAVAEVGPQVEDVRNWIKIAKR